MSRNPFDPTFDRLPRQLPVFPLSGVLLLPRGPLPLNVFEPRYLAMMEDALGAGRMIGMVQPLDPDAPGKAPPIYATGCAGRITAFTETDDGRLIITLTGVCRFKVARELDLVHGYRRVVPDWSAFADDLVEEPSGEVDRPRLLRGLRSYFRTQGIQANWAAIEAAPDERLVSSVSMICPFSSSEKQALLEAPALKERAKLLIALVEMAILDGGEGERAAHRH